MQKVFGLLLGALIHSDQRSEFLNRVQSISGGEEIVDELAQV